MEPTPRPARWRRRDARRRSSVRRLLLWGGATGLVAGLIAQRAVDHNAASGSTYEWLIRGALVLPAVIFFAWWLLFPGIALDEPAEDVTPKIDAEERLERIEATFDAAAVPRARRTSFDEIDADARREYLASVRRDPTLVTGEPTNYGVRRPVRRDVAAEAADVADAAS